MREKRKLAGLLIVVMLVMAWLPECCFGGPEIVSAAAKSWESTLNLGLKDTYTLSVGKTAKKVTWKSSNKKVAKVTSKGKVTAVGYGAATITAKTGNKTYKCKVTVYVPSLYDAKGNFLGNIEDFNGYSILTVGDTLTVSEDWGKIKSCSSNNKKVASVSSKGKIKAKKSGVAKITVKDTLGRTMWFRVVVQKKGTTKIAPTAIQKKRMKNSEYVSYDKLVKNNTYDKTIITDQIVKKTALKSVDNRQLPYMGGIVLEERGQINNFRSTFSMKEVYSGGMTADYVTEEELAFMAANGADCVRMVYSLSYLSKGSNTGQINLTELQVLDEIVSWCMKYDLTLMLSYSEVPGYTAKTSTNILHDDSWMTDASVRKDMERYMALIAQRYADLPNSAVMYELEAEPEVARNADGSLNMELYCQTNNQFADAIWAKDSDAVCIVEAVGDNYFPTACAEHGINIASHADGVPERVGDYYTVGVSVGSGTVYDPVEPCYLPTVISEASGPMTFEAAGGFAKQEIYVGAMDEGCIMSDGVSLVEIRADGTPLTITDMTDTYIKATIPAGTKQVTLHPLTQRVCVDAVRFGDLVIPTIGHYWARDEEYGSVLKQPVITIAKDGTYKDNMYNDLSEWWYQVWIEDYDKLCQKYGVTFLRTEVGIGMDPLSSDPNGSVDTCYDLGLNPDNYRCYLNIIENKLKVCKEHGISWMAWCTNDTFMPASQLTSGSLGYGFRSVRAADTQMVQWKKTGFWYLESTMEVFRRY